MGFHNTSYRYLLNPSMSNRNFTLKISFDAFNILLSKSHFKTRKLKLREDQQKFKKRDKRGLRIDREE